MSRLAKWLLAKDDCEERGVVFSADLWRSIRKAGVSTASGEHVTPLTAMQVTAVYACVRILAETVASLPLVVYRRLGRGRDEVAYDHPLYRALHDEPNPEMTSFTWRETEMAHVSLWGNAYSEIEPNGRDLWLWPLRPDRMTVDRRADGQLEYIYSPGVDEPRRAQRISRLPAERVLHIPGLAFNGIVGLSPIAYNRQAIGLSMAAEKYGARFFGKDTAPHGILKLKSGNLRKDQADQIKAEWEQMHGGENSRSVAVMGADLEWQPVGLPNEDAQFLQTRGFQLGEIARMFRVPPHLIADTEKSTSWGTGIEQQNIGFVVHTIRPWLVRWEQALNRRLFSPVERERYYVKFNVDGLLRGDYKSRQEGLAIQRQNGIINADEWRALENMNPTADGSGSIYLVNGNMVPVKQAGQQPVREGSNGQGA